MSTRIFSQQEIDNVLRSLQKGGEEVLVDAALPYDFRRPDRIAKEQLRSLNTLYENFARSLASSLSAFLRQYVMVSVASVEQLSFRDFVQILPSPTCIVTLGLQPYDAQALLELNHALVFPIFEKILGGKGSGPITVDRQTTEIERTLLDSVFKLILHDLSGAWQAITEMEFYIDSHESQPALLQTLSPNEAIVATSLEIRIGQHSGIMNLGFPSVVIHMLRQKFARPTGMQRSRALDSDSNRILQLVKVSKLSADVRLQGGTVLLKDLLRLDVDDIVRFDHPAETPIPLLVNGTPKFLGQVVSVRDRCGYQVQKVIANEP